MSAKQVNAPIVIVDDNRAAAKMLAAIIKKVDGRETQLAFDGPGALQLIRQTKPKIVFLDIGLPGMDGLEVAREIRQDEDMKKVFLVAVTGYGREEDRRLIIEAGFDQQFLKPIQTSDLRTLLAENPADSPP